MVFLYLGLTRVDKGLTTLCTNVIIPPMKTTVRKSKLPTIPKGTPIVIPGAEHMTKEEVAKAKHAEKMRRQMSRRNGKEPVAKLTKQELRKVDTKELIELSKEVRNMAVVVVAKKLQQLLDDPDELKRANTAQLATTYGILFDKARMAEGLSTENIAINAKIDVTMNSGDAMDALNKMREKYVAQDNK